MRNTERGQGSRGELLGLGGLRGSGAEALGDYHGKALSPSPGIFLHLNYYAAADPRH